MNFKFLISLALLLSFASTGCTNLNLSEDNVIYSSNRKSVKVSPKLSSEIIQKLINGADLSHKNGVMPKALGNHISVGGQFLGVETDTLTLMDDWWIRTWIIKKVEEKLEAELNQVSSFKNLGQAKQAGCEIVKLRNDSEIPNCILKWFKNSILYVNIYDWSKESNSFTISKQLKVPSWYEKAKVTYHPYGAGPVHMVGISFEGNRGTGVFQTLFTLILWDGKSYIPTLLETISYRLTRSLSKSFKQTVHINLLDGSLEIKSHYTEEKMFTYFEEKSPNYTLESYWSEKLSFEEATGSFYSKGDFANSNYELLIRNKIKMLRAYFLDYRPSFSGDDFSSYFDVIQY